MRTRQLALHASLAWRDHLLSALRVGACMEEGSQGVSRPSPHVKGHPGSNKGSANSLAEKDGLRWGDKQEGCTVVMATDEKD